MKQNVPFPRSATTGLHLQRDSGTTYRTSTAILTSVNATLEPARCAATMPFIADTQIEHALLLSVDVRDSNMLLIEVYEVTAKLRAAWPVIQTCSTLV